MERVEIDQAEWEKRVRICQRMYANFASRMVIKMGLIPVPVLEMPAIEGIFHIVGKVQFVKATDEDLIQADKIIAEANERYKERKARPPKKGEPKVADLIGPSLESK